MSLAWTPFRSEAGISQRHTSRGGGWGGIAQSEAVAREGRGPERKSKGERPAAPGARSANSAEGRRGVGAEDMERRAAPRTHHGPPQHLRRCLWCCRCRCLSSYPFPTYSPAPHPRHRQHAGHRAPEQRPRVHLSRCVGALVARQRHQPKGVPQGTPMGAPCVGGPGWRGPKGRDRGAPGAGGDPRRPARREDPRGRRTVKGGKRGSGGTQAAKPRKCGPTSFSFLVSSGSEGGRGKKVAPEARRVTQQYRGARRDPGRTRATTQGRYGVVQTAPPLARVIQLQRGPGASLTPDARPQHRPPLWRATG